VIAVQLEDLVGSCRLVSPTMFLPWAIGGLLTLFGMAKAVKVDLQPCIISQDDIDRDVYQTGEAYIASEFYKGYWGASQLIFVVTGGEDLELQYADDHGKCNVVFVGIEPTETQKGQLDDYSRTFKVRVVYFGIS
ncbi:unnamed protein product, partial [Discosporangium mesarthrocarpum]